MNPILDEFLFVYFVYFVVISYIPLRLCAFA